MIALYLEDTDSYFFIIIIIFRVSYTILFINVH